MTRRSATRPPGRVTRDEAAATDVHLPTSRPSPARQVTTRVIGSVIVMLIVAALVWLDRSGYRDGGAPEGDPLSFLDAIYYSTVSLSTTGYGDITPTSDLARTFNIIVITPLRILFLALLVGTTLEVLTKSTRAAWRENRWRQNLLAHTVVVGFGVKGKAAASSLLETGTRPEQIVVIDKSSAAIKAANDAGFAGIVGDGTRRDILDEAAVPRAAKIVVATDDDSRTAMVVLTARKMNRTAAIVASVRENENADLIEQSGASTVITGAESAGRLLGIAAYRPQLGAVVEDLLEAQSGLELIDREVTPDEFGLTPGEVTEPVMGVVRQEIVYRFDDPAVSSLQRGDHLVVARSVRPAN